MVRSALLVALVVPSLASGQDACPDDPDKVEPGLCGCGVPDSDWTGDGIDDSCLHPAASVDGSVVPGLRARVDADAQVGPGTVLGRRSEVGEGATVGDQVWLGAQARIGHQATVGDDSVLGYGSTIGDEAHLGEGVVLGAFSSAGNGAQVESSAVLARSASVGDEAVVGVAAVLGPEVRVGDRSVVQAGVRVRRGATVGQDATVQEGSRVGRDVRIGRGAQVEAGAVLRGDVVVGDWATVGADSYLPRGTVIPPVNDAPVIDDVDVPATVDLLSTTQLSVSVSDPQVGQPLFALWSFDGAPNGWTLIDPESLTPSLSVGDGDSAPTVTVRVTVSDGTFEDATTRTVSHRNDPPVIEGVDVPGSLDMNSSVQLSADATDPQGQDVELTWSLVGGGSGWNVSPTGVLSVGGFGSSASVTVRITATDGYASASMDRSVSLNFDTPSTCNELRGTGAPSGVYTIQPPGSGPFQAYCDMDSAGGGWTLISNRRANSLNRESCGSNLRGFFTGGCGSPTAIGASQSYALNQSQRVSLPRTEMLVVQYLNGVPDWDDAYIVNLSGQSGDLFPNTSSLQQIPVTNVCTLSGSCDSFQVYWKYIGDYWFHNASCASSSSGDSEFRGNYGLCHEGVSTSGNREGDWASRFAGNRMQYDETKLWGYPSFVGRQYQERIFYR